MIFSFYDSRGIAAETWQEDRCAFQAGYGDGGENGPLQRRTQKAGALLSLDGLQPLTTGARVAFPNGTPTITDGSSVEAKEVVGGYWILQANSSNKSSSG